MNLVFTVAVSLCGLWTASSFILHAELVDDAQADAEAEFQQQEQTAHIRAHARPNRQVRVITRDQFGPQSSPFRAVQVANDGSDRYWQGMPQPLVFGQAAPGTKDNYWSGVAQPVQFPVAPPNLISQNGQPPKIGSVNGAKEAYVYQAFAAPPLQPQFGAPFGNPQWQPVPNFGG